MKKDHSRRVLLVVLLLVVGAGAYYLLSPDQMSQQPTRRAAARAVPVDVAKVTSRSVPVSIHTIGTIQARSTVSVRSRVDGQLLKADFTEGQLVTKGQPLFSIDPRPFDAKLREAQANLARDQAAYNKATADFARYQSLSNKGYSSQQTYEQARAAKNELAATIRADQANIDLAKLDLEFTTIRAPIAGRTGSVLVHPGNLVKANDLTQPLVVINETDPILAQFSVPERHLAEIKQRFADGTLDVVATVPESNRPPVHGKLVFINNAVDTQTGTIMLKASFDNPDGFLTPGQFVHISMQMHMIADTHVVPDRSLQEGRDGTYLFVVKANNTVEPVTVTRGPSVDGLTSIGDALKVGDTVVTDGQLRLFKGAKVSVKAGGAKEAANAGAAGSARAGKAAN